MKKVLTILTILFAIGTNHSLFSSECPGKEKRSITQCPGKEKKSEIQCPGGKE